MSKERSVLLSELNDSIQAVSLMLEVVREKNKLERENEETERQFVKKRNQYEEMIPKLKDFLQTEEEETLRYSLLTVISILQSKLRMILEQMQPAVTTNSKISSLCYQIEGHKAEILSKGTEKYRKLKLTKKEIPKDKLYELAVLILLIHENDLTMTEANFFQEPAAFIKMLIESHDPILTNLVYHESILKSNWLDMFLNTI